jgi:hypothetical protein
MSMFGSEDYESWKRKKDLSKAKTEALEHEYGNVAARHEELAKQDRLRSQINDIKRQDSQAHPSFLQRVGQGVGNVAHGLNERMEASAQAQSKKGKSEKSSGGSWGFNPSGLGFMHQPQPPSGMFGEPASRKRKKR